MINLYKSLKLILVATALILTACHAESNKIQPVKKMVPQEKAPQIPAVRPTYDFERTLQSCKGAICSLKAPVKMKMSSYSPSLIQTMGLSQNDTLAVARGKLTSFYSGMVSSGLGGTTDPKLKMLAGQLSPGNNTTLDEYDIVIRTKGMSSGALVRDWGARVRCAPVTENTPWQTSPCN